MAKNPVTEYEMAMPGTRENWLENLVRVLVFTLAALLVGCGGGDFDEEAEAREVESIAAGVVVTPADPGSVMTDPSHMPSPKVPCEPGDPCSL